MECRVEQIEELFLRREFIIFTMTTCKEIVIGLALCTRVEMVRGGGSGRPVHLQRLFLQRIRTDHHNIAHITLLRMNF